MLFADGGWKYLSTNLWATDYDDLPRTKTSTRSSGGEAS